MKNTLFRRVLTFILSLTFVLSTVFGALSTVNAVGFDHLTPRAAITSDGESALPAASANTTNLLLGVLPSVFKNTGSGDVGVNSPASSSAPLSNLTDGDATTKTDFGAVPFSDSNGQDMSETYSVALTFDLKSPCDLNQLVVINDSGFASLITEHYTVFASNDLNKLYNDESFVIDVSGNNKKRNIISFDSAINARYIGIRVYDPGNYSVASQQYIRMHEIALFGKGSTPSAPPSTEINSDSEKTLPDAPTGAANLLLGVLPSVLKNIGSGDVAVNNPTSGSTPLSNLTDGDATTKTDFGAVPFSDSNGQDMSETYSVALTFDLKSACNLSQLVVINDAGFASLITEHYAVFASNDPSSLYNSNNLVIDVSGNASRRNIITFASNTNARYIGIRVYDPGNYSVASQQYIRMHEIALFGKKSDLPGGEGTDLFTATSSDTYELDSSLGSKNFIAGRTDDIKGVYYSDFGNASATTTTSILKLGDGDFSDNFRVNSWVFAEYDSATDTSKYIGSGIEEGKYWVDIYIPLGNEKDITGIQYMSVGGTITTYKYQIYIANSEANLFNPESLVINFTNSDAKKVNSFKAKETLKGSFVGIRILDPTVSKGTGSAMANENGNNYIYPRIQEFAVFGSDVGGGSTIPSAGVIMDNTKEMPATTKKNLLEGLNFSSLKFVNTDPKHPLGAGTFDCYTSGGGDTLTDNLPTGDWRSAAAFAAYYDEVASKAYYIGDGIEEGAMYYDMVFDIGTDSKLSALAIFNHDFASLRTRKYEIYFGKDESSLFQNKFYTVDNSQSAQRHIFDLEKLNGGEVVTARFLGIRIIDPTSSKGVGLTEVTGNTSSDNNIYPRFNEIALYGEYVNPNYKPSESSVLFDNTSLLPNWGKNLVKGLYPKSLGTTPEGTERKTPNAETALSDENLSGDDYRHSSFPFASNASGAVEIYGSNGDGSYYLDLIYDLKSEAVIDGMAIFHHRSSTLRTKDYEIFASVDYDTLFKVENSKGRVDNNGYFRNAWNYKDLGQTFNARYIALRVYNPTQYPATDINAANCGNIYLRLIEWAVFGQYVDPTFSIKEKFTPLGVQKDYSVFEGQGKNLLEGKTCLQPNVSGKTAAIYDSQSSKFVDGDVTSGFDITTGKFISQDGSTFFQMHYDISEGGTKQYYLSSFIYLGLNSTFASAYTGWWQLYISDDIDALWDSENMAFEYNAIRDEDPDPGCPGQLIEFDEPILAGYIGIRILACNTTMITSVYPRIYELGAFGIEAPVDSTPANLANKLPVDAYTVDKSGKIEKFDDSDFTAKMSNALTDDKTSTKAVFKVSKKNLNVVYNLCQDVEVSEILIKAAEGTKFKKVNIYASLNYADVWSDKALISKYNGSGKNTISKEILKETKFRYVRFEILDKTDSVSISEIQILGPTFRLLKNNNQVRSNASIDFFTQNLKSGELSFFSPKASDRINNSIILDAFGFSKGIEGKDTANIIAKFTDIKVINRIILNFPEGAFDFMPTLTEIYIGENLNEQLKTGNVEPIYTLKGVPKDSVIDLEIRPTVAQEILIRFVSGGEAYGYLDEMSFAISEFRVFGSGVKGLNPNSTNVIDFEDKDLGIKWGITKQSVNDVYSEIAASTVTVSKVTNWQKRSLEKTPYMKIIGGKKYTFKFFDLTGKEITNFGDRNVAISFKFRDGMTSTTSMIGRASNKWYIEPYDSTADAVDREGYITAYAEKDFDNLTFSMLKMISSVDPYWDTIGPLEDYGDEEPQYAPTTVLDATTSTKTIVTGDEYFYIDPRGALRLPVDSVFKVETTTWEIPSNIYDALATNGVANPDEIAVSYLTDLTQDGITHRFDGKVKLKLYIPEIIKGYFGGYKLVNIDENGNSSFIDYTREGDYIFFETSSLDDYALIGVDYHADGSAIIPDDFTGFDEDQLSPQTGDHQTILYIILASVSLFGIVLLNCQKRTSKH